MKKQTKETAMPIPVAQEPRTEGGEASGSPRVFRGAERPVSPPTPRAPGNPPRPGDADYNPMQVVKGPVVGPNPTGHTDQALVGQPTTKPDIHPGGDAGKEV